MPVTKDDVDEIRERIARDIRDVIKGAVNTVANTPLQAGEDPQSAKTEKKIAQRAIKALLDSAEANYREAQARVVEKKDPKRAERIRKIVPEW